MKATTKSTQEFMSIIGCHNYYQIVLNLIYLMITMISQIPMFYLPYMTSLPIISYKDLENGVYINRNTTLTKEFCTNGTNFEIIKELSLNNWSIEFNLYCDTFRTSLLSSCFYLGSILSYTYIFFFDKNCKESSIKAISFLFTISTALIYIENYYAILIYNIILGFCQLLLSILCLSVVAEISCQEYRSYFTNIQYLASNIGSFIINFLIEYKISWRVCYIGMAIIMLFFNLINLVFIVSNPVYQIIVKKNFNKAKDNALYIMKFNNIKQIEDVEFDSDQSELEVNIEDKILKENDLSENLLHKSEKYTNSLLNTYKSKVSKYTNFTKKSNLTINKHTLKDEQLTLFLLSSSKQKSLEIIKENDIKKVPEGFISSTIVVNAFIKHFKQQYENNKKIVLLNKANNDEIVNVVSSDSSDNNLPKKQINDEDSILFKLKLQIILILHLVGQFLVIYESKKFSYGEHIFLIMNMSSILQILVMIFYGYFMNISFIGRKYSYVIMTAFSAIWRIVDLILGFYNIFIYYAVRIFFNNAHISINTLIIESFSNKGRVKYFGLLYFVAKIFVYFTPFIYEYCSQNLFDIILIIIATFAIFIAIFFIEETNGKILKDE